MVTAITKNMLFRVKAHDFYSVGELQNSHASLLLFGTNNFPWVSRELWYFILVLCKSDHSFPMVCMKMKVSGWGFNVCLSVWSFVHHYYCYSSEHCPDNIYFSRQFPKICMYINCTVLYIIYRDVSVLPDWFTSRFSLIHKALL